MDDLRDDCRTAYREIAGPGPDEIDDAIATLRRAKAILKDAEMMAAIRERHAENRAAVAAGTKETE
jgi:hypothetical protein